MTQPSSPPRCQVEVEAPDRVRAFLLGSETVSRASYICGEPFVPIAGPCETCGLEVSITALDGGSHLRAEGHVFQPPSGCPLHGAPDRGEA